MHMLTVQDMNDTAVASHPAVVHGRPYLSAQVSIHQDCRAAGWLSSLCAQGMGRQVTALYINLVGQGLCAAPLALLLPFKLGWGVEGVAAGLALGTVIQACSYLVILLDLDWVGTAARIAAYHKAKALEQKNATDVGA